MQGKPVPPACKHDVSIFFSNIAGYDSLRGSMDPAALFDTLERISSKLDHLAATSKEST